MKKIVLLFVFLLAICAVCSAEFIVYFNDHTQRTVTKIEFKGDYADLYLSTGLVMTVPTRSINFEVTGIERPSSAYGVTVYGKGKSAPTKPAESQQKTAPVGISQAELKKQFDESDQVAVAGANVGSIRKGDRVHIVATTDMSYTVIAKESDGSYRKVVFSAENFAETFEIEKKAAAPRYVPPPPPVAEPVTPPASAPRSPAIKQIVPRLPKEMPPISEPIGPRPSLFVPFAMSMALLLIGIGLTLVLSRKQEEVNRKGREGRKALKA